MRLAAKAAAAATHDARIRAIINENSDFCALKVDVFKRDFADVLATLQERACSSNGSEADLKGRLLQKLLMQISALGRRVPWYPQDKALYVELPAGNPEAPEQPSHTGAKVTRRTDRKY